MSSKINKVNNEKHLQESHVYREGQFKIWNKKIVLQGNDVTLRLRRLDNLDFGPYSFSYQFELIAGNEMKINFSWTKIGINSLLPYQDTKFEVM